MIIDIVLLIDEVSLCGVFYSKFPDFTACWFIIHYRMIVHKFTFFSYFCSYHSCFGTDCCDNSYINNLYSQEKKEN